MDMSINDVLVILSIVSAIISIAYASDRRIWFYKFSKQDLWISIGIFLTVNYFIFFDLFKAWGIYFPSLTEENEKYPTPQAWAYLISIVFIVYIIYKIVKAPFPESRKEALLDYYQTLISSHISLLISYINEYHYQALKEHILQCNQRHTQTYSPQNKYKRDEFPAQLLQQIIFSKPFISASLKQHPLFFLQIAHNLYNPNLVGYKDSVGYYYREMIKLGNPFLTEGLNQTNNFAGTKPPQKYTYRLSDSIFSLLTFGNILFTYHAKVWEAFGEEGYYDVYTNSIFDQPVNEFRDERYRNTPARLCIIFYDIFIRQLFHAKFQSIELPTPIFIYPHYICLICEAKTQNREEDNIYAFKLSGEILHYLHSWLSFLSECKSTFFEIDILNIPKQLITWSQLTPSYKAQIARWYIETLLDTTINLDETEAFTQQYLLNFNQLINEINHKNILSHAWTNIDHVKYQTYPLYTTIKTLIPT